MIIIKELFADIVDQMRFNDKPISFKFGYWSTVAAELLNEGRSKALTDMRFPLIFLNADIQEKDSDFRTIEINPTFYIITQTEAKYDIDTRLEMIYKTELYPIYKDFIKAIRKSHKFWIYGGQVPHDKKDMFYLQNLAANQNKINMIVDAIEVRFNKLDMIKSVYNYYDNDR